MSEKIISSTDITLTPGDNKRLMSLCGRFDEHLRLIEKRLGVEIHNRGNQFQIIGDHKPVQVASKLIESLYRQTEKDKDLTPNKVHLAIQESTQGISVKKAKGPHEPAIAIPLKYQTIKPRTANQTTYLKNIEAHDINFGVGPAGTGKTYLAVACAVQALQSDEVRRILLVRPAVEAGERLGFLPGDLAQKIDPYLRPLFDALYEMIGFERTYKLIERNVIEIAPLAYMRGRTLNDSFVILDEAQNTTKEQMKMFLTRIGFSSKVVITGDVTQVDLPRGERSGLIHVLDVLKGVQGISFNHFESKDVVRHPLVQKIVDAYDDEKGDKS